MMEKNYLNINSLKVSIELSNFINEELNLFWVIIQENIILSLKGSLNNLLFKNI